MRTRYDNALVICSCAALALVALGVSGPLFVSLSHGNLDGRLFGACVLITLCGVYACGVAWLFGLARAARVKQWDWFVVVLALGPIGALLYGLQTTRTGLRAY